MADDVRAPEHSTRWSASASTSNLQALPPRTNKASDTSSISSGTLTEDSQASEFARMADALGAISQGALRRISNNEEVVDPIVQCVQIKPMGAGTNGEPRYRVVWNDTINFIQSMITTQSTWIVTEGKLKKGSVCRLKQFQSNFVKDKL